MKFLRWYSRVALALGLAFTVPYILAMRDAGLFAIPSLLFSGALLMQALVVTPLFMIAARSGGAAGGPPRREPRWHLAALALLAAGFAMPLALHSSAAAQAGLVPTDTSFSSLAQALARGTPADVTRLARQLDADGRSSVGELVAEEVGRLHLDNLKALQAAGLTVVPANDDYGWSELVRSAVQTETDQRPPSESDRVAVVSWLLAQGEPYGYSLRKRTGDLFIRRAQHIDLATKFGSGGLFDRLVAHGADVNDCSDYACPLWHAAQAHDASWVAFLLAHGAVVGAAAGENHTTALGEAIIAGDAASVKLLLAAGARPTADERHDDVLNACASAARDGPDIVAGLHAARVHITADRIDAAGDGLAPAEKACARGFLGQEPARPSAGSPSRASTPDPASGRTR